MPGNFFFIHKIEVVLPQEYLDFEKPIAELEKKIEELTLFTSNGNVDLEEEVLKLHKKADQEADDYRRKVAELIWEHQAQESLGDHR